VAILAIYRETWAAEAAALLARLRGESAAKGQAEPQGGA
jgi:hypothetical protein